MIVSVVIKNNPSVRPVATAYKVATKRTVASIAKTFKSQVQTHISPPLSAWPTTGKVEIATGLLRRSWKVTQISDYHARVDPIYGTKADIYRKVHEEGRVIRAVHYPRMVFTWEGRRYKAEKVRIRKKAFFKKSNDDMKRLFGTQTKLNREFSSHLTPVKDWRNRASL